MIAHPIPKGQVAFALISLLLGVAAIITGIGYRAVLDNGQIGPGFMPLLAGVVVVIFALLDLVQVLTSKQPESQLESAIEEDLALVAAERRQAFSSGTSGSADSPEEVQTAGVSDSDDDAPLDAKAQNVKFIKVIFVLFAAVALMPVLGFIIAFTAMMLTLTLWVERQPVLRSVIISVAAIAVMYSIFALLLSVPLPVGPLGF